MKKPTEVVLRVSEMPEMLWALRREMAHILREGAKAEKDRRVGDRLLEYAAAFESGQRSGTQDV